MNYQVYFDAMKERVSQDLGDHFNASRLNDLRLSLSQSKSQNSSTDHYRSRAAKVPAYYNPNTHSVHLNVGVLETASTALVENIYYHELVHAASHHARIVTSNKKMLKSGLKIQVWDESDNQETLHRSLNEGVTQYFANIYTEGGSAYKNEVHIIGKLIQRIGLHELRAAYFGPDIQLLEEKVRTTLGDKVFQRLSLLVDRKHFEAAEVLLGR